MGLRPLKKDFRMVDKMDLIRKTTPGYLKTEDWDFKRQENEDDSQKVILDLPSDEEIINADKENVEKFVTIRCKRCPKEFEIEITKKGRPRTLCDTCSWRRKTQKGQIGKKAKIPVDQKEEKPKSEIIEINFTDRQFFYELLEKYAKEDIRTVQEQALFYVIRALKESKINK